MRNQVAIILLGWGFLSFAGKVRAFPENVRMGYASCRSCHVSPAGGGLLTAYGRLTSEEFLSTWMKSGESDFAYGAVKTPEHFNFGGDIRTLAIDKDNRVYETKRYFPMQADFEAAYAFTDKLTVALTLGAYDQDGSSRRHYIMYTPSDNFSARAGRFYPAYGIYNGDHSLLTRRTLGFDENQETYNLEGGFYTQKGEVIVTAILKNGFDTQNEDRSGFAARAVFYAGERSQAGISLMHNEGNLWRSDSYGPFFIWAFTPTFYWESEADTLSRKAVEKGDSSIADYAAILGYTRLAYEVVRGMHLLVTYEDLSPQSSNHYLAHQSGIGPGAQWFVRPHLDLMGKVEQRVDETWSVKAGMQAMLLAHFYF